MCVSSSDTVLLNRISVFMLIWGIITARGQQHPSPMICPDEAGGCNRPMLYYRCMGTEGGFRATPFLKCCKLEPSNIN